MDLSEDEKIKPRHRDASPDLNEDKMSYCSSAMCGYEFPENGRNGLVSSANLMFASGETDAIEYKLDDGTAAHLLNSGNVLSNKMDIIEETHCPEMEQSPYKKPGQRHIPKSLTKVPSFKDISTKIAPKNQSRRELKKVFETSQKESNQTSLNDGKENILITSKRELSLDPRI